jgi:N-acetylmuramoyl-L-alanine amidase
MERKIFLSAGHSNVPGKDMGADGLNGLKEGVLTVELRDLIVKELGFLNQYVITDPNHFVTKDTVTLINAILDSRDVAIDIHFNAFAAESARGCEVLIPFNSSKVEKELAQILVDNISAVLATKNRGIKTEADSARKHLMFMTPNCENILIEVCFITNKADVLMYVTKKDFVAKVVAKCIFDYITKLN